MNINLQILITRYINIQFRRKFHGKSLEISWNFRRNTFDQTLPKNIYINNIYYGQSILAGSKKEWHSLLLFVRIRRKRRNN
nr:MAG TPA: hypothetical protein [Caudoviricetes sp.]